MISRTVPERVGFEPCAEGPQTVAFQRCRSLSRNLTFPHRRVLRKRAVLQRIGIIPVY